MASVEKALPPLLQGVFFDFHWETAKSWSLPTAVSVIQFEKISWHLGLPVWSTQRGEMRFDLSPASVLANPSGFPYHWERIINADLGYALEMFQNGGRWVILDGYHRLARHFIEKNILVPVRYHPDQFKERIVAKPD